MYNILPLNTLLGMTMSKVEEVNSDELHLITDTGKVYKLLHLQNCCETVYIEDITGDLNDLVGEPILLSEVSTSEIDPPGHEVSEYIQSKTWTFFKFATIKGYVDVRFFGSSNGYYSESASLIIEE